MKTKKVVDINNLTPTELAKIKSICFNLGKRFVKIYYNDKDFELYVDKKNTVYAKFMHWSVGLGKGIVFVFENQGDLLRSFDWKYCKWEEAQYPQINGIIDTLSRINDNYKQVVIQGS